MTIGAALLLIAAGAILRFAIATVSTHGVDLHTIGDILMVIGGLGLLLWLVIWAPRSRGRREGYDQRPPPGANQPPERYRYPPPPREPTEDDYRTEQHYRGR